MHACTKEDREGRCDADEGEPCPKCVVELKIEAAYWLAQYQAAPASEKMSKEQLDEQLRDAGRAHLIRA
jgi:hypothetical protein